MTSPTELQEYWQSVLESDPDGHGLIDRCSLWPFGKVEGGAAGDTFTHTQGATNIPCLREPAGHNFQYVVGGKTHTASHRLYLIRSDEALAIKPTHLIKIQPRDDVGELVFEQPAILGNTFDPLVSIAAQLVIQGYA